MNILNEPFEDLVKKKKSSREKKLLSHTCACRTVCPVNDNGKADGQLPVINSFHVT